MIPYVLNIMRACAPLVIASARACTSQSADDPICPQHHASLRSSGDCICICIKRCAESNHPVMETALKIFTSGSEIAFLVLPNNLDTACTHKCAQNTEQHRADHC